MADAVRGNAPTPAGPLDRLTDPGEAFRNPGQLEFVRQLVRFLKDAFRGAIFRDQSAPHFHLQSPGGKTFKVTVGEDGALRTEYVRG